jgi:DNA-binding response OmpR family regulator
MSEPMPLAAVPKGARILLIEDEYLIAEMVCDMITDLGCHCIGPIITMDEGLKAATTETCDAAIINLVIQGRHAYAIAAALAARNIPFCFASGLPQHDIQEQWRARPFLAKPYALENVHAFLLAVLASPST